MPFVIIAGILILDQLTKAIISQHYALNESHPVVSGIFHLTLVHNTGAAFGLFKNQLPFFITTALIAVILIGSNLHKHRGSMAETVAMSLILAGAVGNLIDRLRVGYVIDFLDFRVWPVFNIADSAITVGALILVYSIIRQRH